MITLTQIAEQHRVRIRRNECGDQIIQGGRGHLYVDGGRVCVVWTDARPMNKTRLRELGGAAWQGDISPNAKGRRVQDAWVKGVLPDRIEQALRMVGAKRKRQMSEAALAHLARMRQSLAGTQRQPLESLGGCRNRGTCGAIRATKKPPIVGRLGRLLAKPQGNGGLDWHGDSSTGTRHWKSVFFEDCLNTKQKARSDESCVREVG